MFFHIPVSSLIIIIFSYNKNRARIVCRDVYKQVPSVLAYVTYMWWIIIRALKQNKFVKLNKLS